MERKKILFVDDEAALTRLVKMNLEATGRYQVRVANQGLEAVEAARSFKPDLIFLDVIMPDMGGAEVADKLEADEALKGIPLVFMTAIVSCDEVQERKGLIGGHPFLAKPASFQQIVNCIRQQLYP